MASTSEFVSGRKKLLYIEKCNWNNCQEQAKSKCAGCCVVFYCSQQHQKLDWRSHKPNCLNWTINNVEDEPQHLIARKFIKTGTVLLVDQPLIVFRDMENIGKDLCQLLLVAGAYSYPCVGCGFGHLDVKAPHFCTKCSIPLCNENCENNILHATQECSALQEVKMHNFRSSRQGANICQDVFILRILIQMKRSDNARKRILELIQDQRVQTISDNLSFNQATGKLTNFPKQDLLDDDIEHLFPFSFKYCRDDRLIRNIYCTMTFFASCVNNVDGEKALYRNRIFLDHSCVPNAEMWIDSSLSYYKLCVRAKCMIRPGEKITICVDDSLLCLPTLERRNVLRAVHQIECKCRRCIDPSECKLFVSGIRCTFSKCQDGFLVPKLPLDESSVWKCHLQNCKHTERAQEMRAKILKLEEELAYCSSVEAKTYSRIELFIKNNKGVLHQNHFLMQKATFHLGKIANYFLGSGAKLVLCVIAEFRYASKLCERKNEFVRRLIHMHEKYKVGFKEDSGKLNYELACGCLALELVKFKNLKMQFDQENLQDRMKELKKVYALFKDAKALSKFSIRAGSDAWIKDAEAFANIMLDCLKPILHPPKDVHLSMQAVQLIVNSLVDRWIEVATEINLIDEYKKPQSKIDLQGKSLLEILAEKSQKTPVWV